MSVYFFLSFPSFLFSNLLLAFWLILNLFALLCSFFNSFYFAWFPFVSFSSLESMVGVNPGCCCSFRLIFFFFFSFQHFSEIFIWSFWIFLAHPTSICNHFRCYTILSLLFLVLLLLLLLVILVLLLLVFLLILFLFCLFVLFLLLLQLLLLLILHFSSSTSSSISFSSTSSSAS